MKARHLIRRVQRAKTQRGPVSRIYWINPTKPHKARHLEMLNRAPRQSAAVQAPPRPKANESVSFGNPPNATVRHTLRSAKLAQSALGGPPSSRLKPHASPRSASFNVAPTPGLSPEVGATLPTKESIRRYVQQARDSVLRDLRQNLPSKRRALGTKAAASFERAGSLKTRKR